MKIYILNHNYPNAVPEDGSQGDINGETRFVRLQDHLAQVAGRDAAAMALIDEAYARIAELEAEIADLIHPYDLAAYRAKKSLHK